jgi:hypothetical protein
VGWRLLALSVLLPLAACGEGGPATPEAAGPAPGPRASDAPRPPERPALAGSLERLASDDPRVGQQAFEEIAESLGSGPRFITSGLGLTAEVSAIRTGLLRLAEHPGADVRRRSVLLLARLPVQALDLPTLGILGRALDEGDGEVQVAVLGAFARVLEVGGALPGDVEEAVAPFGGHLDAGISAEALRVLDLVERRRERERAMAEAGFWCGTPFGGRSPRGTEAPRIVVPLEPGDWEVEPGDREVPPKPDDPRLPPR